MTKTIRLSLIALVFVIGIASVSTAKGNHAMTMSGTVSSVDQQAKTVALKTTDGKTTAISWTGP